MSRRGEDGPTTLSPRRDLIPDHVAPERLYLEARWAALVPSAAATGLLSDVLPVVSGTNAVTLRQHALRVAERAEAELGEERPCLIDGCPANWAELPIPEGRITIGPDGGDVRDWTDRKANFELIVGRSLPEDRAPRYIDLVHSFDRKPKRRLFELVKEQGLQANQDVTFLTDGDEEVRALAELTTPGSRACPRLVPCRHSPDRTRAIRAASLIMTKQRERVSLRCLSGPNGYFRTAIPSARCRRRLICTKMSKHWIRTINTFAASPELRTSSSSISASSGPA